MERLLVAAKNSKLLAEPGEMVAEVKRCHTTAKIPSINASSSRAMAAMNQRRVLARGSCILLWLAGTQDELVDDNAPFGRTEAEYCWVIRKRSWQRLLSLLIGRRWSIVVSWKESA